ncbi:MAG: phage virion morphogenesis protein [candidate division WOR-3 bacterium]
MIRVIRIPEIIGERELEKIRGVLYGWTVRQMRKGRTWNDEKMEPLTPITLQSRRKKSSIPLQDTGRLTQSVQLHRKGDVFVFMSDLIYAPTHQFGATIRPKRAKFLTIPADPGARYVRRGKWIFARKVRIPARPFFPSENQLPPRLVDEILKIITR